MRLLKYTQGTIYAAILFTALGCESTPARGNDLGRGDMYETTAADVRSNSVSSVTLLEFADQVAESLAARLPSIAEISSKSYRVVIELGDIQNNTTRHQTSRSDFEAIRRRIFISMVANQQITNIAQINEHPRRVQDVAGDFVTDQEQIDLLDEGVEQTQNAPNQYRLSDTYLLNGTFSEIRRGTHSTYLFDMTIVNSGTRAIVFADQFEARQVR